MPTAHASILGQAKLIPAITIGLVLDSLLGIFRTRPAIRVTLAALVGGCINTAVLMAVRVAFGFPWSRLVEVLLAVQVGTNVIVYGAGAILEVLRSSCSTNRRPGWTSGIEGVCCAS
jgi:hypothetical protein